MTCWINPVDHDFLTPQRFTQAFPPCATCRATVREKVLCRHQIFRKWVDGAAKDSIVLPDCPPATHQVVEPQGWLSGFNTHRAARRIQFPIFCWPRNHKVASFRIDQYILNSSQASEVFHGVCRRESLALTLLDCTLETRQ